MKERQIIFSAESVRAILDGRKTQTRRVVRKQVDDEGILPDLTIRPEEAGLWEMCWTADDVGAPPYCDGLMHDLIRCPFGVPGDRLWVKEAFQDYQSGAESDISEQVVFYGDTAPVPAVYPPQKPKLKSPRFMPRKFSRLTLEITEVRCERLQDINEFDAQDEGAEGKKTTWLPTYIENFAKHWNALNAKRGFPWESNPWVWVLTFRKLEEAINHG